MRSMLAVLGVCLTLGFAAPAHADPDTNGVDGDDAGFLAELRHADIGYNSPTQAVTSGRAVCTCLNNGESGLELVHDVQTHNPAFNMDAAATFAVISAKYFCPHQLAKA